MRSAGMRFSGRGQDELVLTAYRRGNLGFRPGACARLGSPSLGSYQFRFLDVQSAYLVAEVRDSLRPRVHAATESWGDAERFGGPQCRCEQRARAPE